MPDATLPPVRVHMLPALFEPEQLADGVAVVIDVLRASTTMTQALASGADRVIPCGSVEEARAAAARLPRGTALLGGERQGVRIDGFDLDNSPRAYVAEAVRGRTIVFTTTNGTAALRRSSRARQIVVGALTNLSAVERWLRQRGLPVHLVCAGTDGQLTAEDILCAGLLAARLCEGLHSRPAGWTPDVPTEMAIDFARRRGADPSAILTTLRESLGGRNLLELGFDADIACAAQVDSVPVVPVFDPFAGDLRTAPVDAI